MWESPFDKACRYLLKLDPAALLAWLLGVHPTEMAFIRWIDTRRLPYPGQPDRTCDTVAHLEHLDENHRPWAIVVEFNIEPDALMFGRLLGYLGSLWIEEKPSRERGDRLEVGAIVVNLTGSGTTSRTSTWQNAGVETRLLVREINFAAMHAEWAIDQITKGIAPQSILPWIPLMQGGSELAIIEKWKEIAASEAQSSRRTDYAALAEVFADAVETRDIWHNALKEWNMIESRVVKEWQDQARKEGRQEGRIQSLLEFLQDKFGSLPAELPNHLRLIEDGNVLRQLLLKAAHAPSLEEFKKQMPNGTQKGSSEH